jgi:NAD(P)-dependent dehydrogenase (short-subunit alcohol dehydrogenase family)
MTGRVQDKVALVTGAGRGQGRSHVVRLAEEGARVIAVDLPAAASKDVSRHSPVPDGDRGGPGGNGPHGHGGRR